MKRFIYTVNIIFSVLVFELCLTLLLGIAGAFVPEFFVKYYAYDLYFIGYMLYIPIFRFIFNLICLIVSICKQSLRTGLKASLIAFLFIILDFAIIGIPVFIPGLIA